MKIRIEEKELEGSALEILDGLRGLAFRDFSSLEEYVRWLVDNLWRMARVRVDIEGKTLGEAAEAIIEALEFAGYCTIVKEEGDADAK